MKKHYVLTEPGMCLYINHAGDDFMTISETESPLAKDTESVMTTRGKLLSVGIVILILITLVFTIVEKRKKANAVDGICNVSNEAKTVIINGKEIQLH